MTSEATKVRIRHARKSDEAFIYATWLRQLWYSSETVTTLEKDMFMRLNHNLIERTLKEDPVIVAVLDEDPNVILGYAAFKDDPYVYVKLAWRETGVQELLIDAMAKHGEN